MKNTTKQLAKEVRLLTLQLARECAAAGDHERASVLFASEGISYNRTVCS